MAAAATASMLYPPSYSHGDNSKQARIRHATFGFWPNPSIAHLQPTSTERSKTLSSWEERSKRRPWGPRKSPSATSFPPSRGNAASRVFAIPELVEMIVTQDAETMLAGLYISKLTRYLSACRLYSTQAQQSLRQLVFEVSATEQLPSLRQILAPLVNLGPQPPNRHTNFTTEDDYSTMDPELRTLATKGPNCKMLIHPSSLFFQIFGYIPEAREIQKDVIEGAHLARAAGLLISGIPRMYPSPEYETDDDVVFSLACQDTRTEGAAARMLLTNQVDMQSAAKRLGHSPFAAAIQHNLWRLLDGTRFLNIAIILCLAKGYTLTASDVSTIRKHKRTDVMEGLLKWAVYCERKRDLETLLKFGTAEDWQTVATLRAERDNEKITPPPPPPRPLETPKRPRSPVPPLLSPEEFARQNGFVPASARPSRLRSALKRVLYLRGTSLAG